MANPEHERVLRGGVDALREWRKFNPTTRLELSRAMCKGAFLWHADLSGADLRSADLEACRMRAANLSGADLTSARLQHVDLTGADLGGATLTHTNLFATNLNSAHLGNCRLDGWFHATVLASVNLEHVQSLESARHLSPSTIGLDTLAQSRGRIPAAFLRGCGLADWEVLAAQLHGPDLLPEEITDIQYQVFALRSGNPIQVRPVFLSHSQSDTEFVEKLETTLQADGIRCWRDVRDLVAGPLDPQIQGAMEHRVVVVVLSEASVRSDWVKAEIDYARRIESVRLKDNPAKYVLCPIALDGSWQSVDFGMPRRVALTEKVIVDFSLWRDAIAYAGSLSKLEAGLRRWY